MPELKVIISDRIQELISAGVVTLDAHFARNGIEVRGRTVQLHTKLGLAPHASYELGLLEQKLAKVAVPPSPMNVRTSLTTDPIKGPRPGSAADYEQYGVGGVSLSGGRPDKNLDFAIQSAARLSLDQVTRGGVKNFLSHETLHVMDLERKDMDHLWFRTCQVADKIGTNRLVSRINAQRSQLNVEGAANLDEWWEGSTSIQKWTLLTSKKKAGKYSGSDDPEKFPPSKLARLQHLGHPFREPETEVGKIEEPSDFDHLEVEEGAEPEW